MKADLIIKNAVIYTSNNANPLAAALVVKDGKFVYVGDEEGLSDYEGEAVDLDAVPLSLFCHCHNRGGVSHAACFSSSGATASPIISASS